MASPSAHVYIDVPPHPVTGVRPAISTTYPADLHFQTTTTTDHRGDIPASQSVDNHDTDAQRGESHEDSSDGLWSMYLTVSEKAGKEVVETWKGDADGILVFTGLFSATVAAFIIEGYRKLSPDAGDTTNALLTQLSGQLVNISNGTPLTSVAAQSSRPFNPTASAVRVNVLWFLSLVLSLNCALSATLMQQWARRYQELTQRRDAIHRRGRMQAYIFDGMSRFKILAQAVVPISTLLHISVFLFFAGLVEFLFPIHATVAYTTLVCIGMFALPYATLTVLPSVYFNCPYGTPMSAFVWRISQASVLEIFEAIRYIEAQFQFHGPFSILWRRTGQQRVTGPPSAIQWKEALDNRIAKYNKWLLNGQRKSAELSAYTAEPRVVTRSLEWTLKALDEDKEIENFAARVPGFFDSRVVPEVTSVVLPLMSHDPKKVPIFGSRLYHLLETCESTSLLDEKTRKNRLRVCLICLWYFGRAYNKPGVSQLLPPYFPNSLIPKITRVQTGDDSSVKVIRRCFVALIANKLAADLGSRNGPINNGELECLSTILGTESRDTKLLLSQPRAIKLANMISLIFGEAGALAVDTVRSNMRIVQQTLGILSGALLVQEDVEAQLDQPFAIISGSDGIFERILVSHLFDLLNACITVTLPLEEEKRTICLRMCLKGLWYFGRAFNQLGNSVPLPSYVYTAFTPEMIRGIRQQRDRAVRELGRCVGALVVNKLAADIKSRTVPIASHRELACLSAILATDRHDVGLLLSQPGVVALANMISLMSDEVGTLAAAAVPSDVQYMVQQTLVAISQALPVQENAELQLDRPVSIINGSDGKFEHILLSRLHDLLNMCIAVNSPLAEEARTCCLRMCLRGLWYFGRAFDKLGNTAPLLTYIGTVFSNPETAGRIREQRDLSVRMIGKCVKALVLNKLAADFHSRIVLVSNSDAELACLSAVLGTNSQDLTLLLSHPGTIEFTNMVSLVFDEIYYTPFRGPTSSVLDVVRQTFGILSRALLAQSNTEMRLDLTDTQVNVVDGTSSLTDETFKSVLRLCLKNLWNFTRAYNEPGNLMPLPSYVRIAFTHTETTPRIRKESDVAAHVIRSCIVALVVNKLAADINARTPPANDEELACLSAVLETNSQDVALLLSHPGAIQLANMIFLVLDDVYDSPSWTPTSDVLDVVRQTFRILSRAQLDGEMRLDPTDTLMDISGGTSSLTHVTGIRALGVYLKNLWHFTRGYIEREDSITLPSYIYIAFTHPEITRRIHKKGDTTVHVIRRCVVALFVNKLTANVDERTPRAPINDAELACLSAVLGTNSQDVTLLLSYPGAIQLANLVFLVLDNMYGSPSWTPTPDVLDVVRQTFSILSQALPAQLDAEMRLDLIDTLADVSKGTLSLTHAMGIRVLGMCLKNLWHFTRAYIERGNSIPLPPYIYVAFTHPEVTRRIRKEGDIAAQVIRRCVGALVVNKLATDINARTTPADDAELESLSSILDSDSRDVRHCLTQPGIVELVNMASFSLGHVGSLNVNDVPPDARNVLQQTLAIISQALPDQENAGLQPDQTVALSNTSDDWFERTVVARLHGFLKICIPNTSSLTEGVRTSCLRMCLKTLWRSAKAYHHNSDPLPPYFPLMLASPEITHHFHTEQDPVARLAGRCFGALIVSKLVDALKSPISLSDHVDNAELVCISAVLGTGYRGDLLLPHQLRVINFQNVISGLSGKIDILFTTEGTPADMLDIAQDTLYILANRLRDRRFVFEDVPMDQQGLLLDIHGEVKNVVRSNSDRLKDETVETLDRLRQVLEKLLPAVESSQDAAMRDLDR